MLNRPYDAIIAMGEWCGVAHNLRRHFRTTSAYPLDWWVISYDGICKLLDEDFGQLLRIDNLRIDPKMDVVHCGHYGIGHAHDFLRDASGAHCSDIQTQLAGLQAKYRALIIRMDAAAAAGRVLAVLHRRGGGSPHHALPDMGTGLHSRLAARWPNADVDLLIVGGGAPGVVETPRGRIALDILEETEPGHWQPRAWDAVLRRQGVTLLKPGRAGVQRA